MKRFLFFFLFVFVSSVSSQAQSLKKINAYLQKNDFVNAGKNLDKLLKKYPGQAAGEYLLTKYLLLSLPAKNYDSAYFHILIALKNFTQAIEKEKSGWQKLGINNDSIVYYKNLIDSLAFEKIKNEEKVDNYRHYINFYPSSKFLKTAEENRNELAFMQAYQSPVPDSLKKFIDSYPNAVQRKEAQARYNILIFESQTKNGTLNDFINFVKQNPDSPYKNIAEKNIFQLSTLHHSVKEYEKFIINNPRNEFLNTARQWLFALFEDEHPDKNFLETFSSFSIDIHWKNLVENHKKTLYPILEEEKYGFMDEDGNTMIASQLDSVPTGYFCEGIKDDLIKAYKKSNLVLLNKEGKEISPGGFDNVEKFDNCLYKTSRKSKIGLLHQSGFQILPTIYDSLNLLAGKIIYACQGKFGQLFSINGKLLKNISDLKVYSFADSLLIFEKDTNMGIVAIHNFINHPHNQVCNNYKNVKIMDGHSLIFTRDSVDYLIFSPEINYNLIFDTTSTNRIEETLFKKYESVTNIKNGFLVKNNLGKSGFYNSKGNKIFDTKYDEIEIWGENLFKVKLNEKTYLINNKEIKILPQTYDGLVQIEKGYVASLRKGKFGILDLKNKINISPVL